MIYDFRFKTKNNDGRFIVSKTIFGFGIMLDFVSATFHRQKRFCFQVDFFFMRFWWNNYKSN